MGMYKYIKETWNTSPDGLKELWKERLIAWRREPSTVRLEHPTRLDRARTLGYRAKEGFLVVRQRVPRGGRMRVKPSGGRKPRRYTRRLTLSMSYQWVAEQRAAQRYPHFEVLNSYYMIKDGLYYWYEIILVDRTHPAIKADPTMKWITEKQHRSRVFRGLTSAGRKSRGLMNKGKGAEKIRPSRRANLRLSH